MLDHSAVDSPCYRPAMKVQKDSKASPIIAELMQQLVEHHKLNSQKENPTLSEKPTKPADLYQDAGGGYNSNFVFPQE